jgi:hypothetical protein
VEIKADPIAIAKTRVLQCIEGSPGADEILKTA